MNKYLRFPSFAIPISLAISLTSCGPKADSALAAVQAVEGLTSLPGETEAISTLTIMPIPTETPASIFRPAPGTIWQWQLDTPVDISVDAQVFDIDLFDNSESVVSALHAKGAKVICYISFGTFENWRPDANQFPPKVIGKKVAGWQGERWLDVRQIELLAPIMLARMDLCKAKGFDGIEPDNIDGYTNKSGFPLTGDHQLHYNRWLSEQAHLRGLSIGLKNDLDQASELVNDFDWALIEECFVYDECQASLPFLSAGKQVLDVEYVDQGPAPDITLLCSQAKTLGIDLIFKEVDLTAFRQTCY